jgi:DNA-binding transcriptional MerR regulator
VARELGVAPSTLRSWERRYRTVVPSRGANGQRLYDSDQVAALRRILAQTRRGVRAHMAHEAAGIARPLRTSRLRLDPTSEGPMIARREIDRLLLESGSHDDRFAFNARLVASEIVKNAVVHGPEHEQIEIEIELCEGWIDVRVHNGGGRLALKNLRSRRREHGHGLDIVDALAASWTIDTGPRGTRVSVRLSTDDQADV